MNDTSQRLLTLARSNADIFLNHPQVKAIGVAGSVARGQADSFSDIDMSVYYEELPSEVELKSAYEQNQGSDYRILFSDRDIGVFAEQYFIQNVKCDIGHFTLQRMKLDIEEVLEHCNPDDPMLKVMAGILEMLPLHGAELIEQWKIQVAAYPNRLAQAMVQKHLHFRGIWVVQNYGVKRGDILFFTDELLQTIKKIIGVLVGLNHIYHPINSVDFKGIKRLIDKMDIAPQNFSSRLYSLFYLDQNLAINVLGELIEETFILVETHMPEIDTTAARKYYQLWSNRFNVSV